MQFILITINDLNDCIVCLDCDHISYYDNLFVALTASDMPRIPLH